jgi:hypothetical protein
MRWHQSTGGEEDDESDSGFGPSRQGANRGDERDDDHHPASAGSSARDERLAGFAPDGKWESCPPSGRLARLLESVSGGQWQCPGAAHDELVGMVRGWAAVESWASAAKLGVIRELIRREDKPWQPADRDCDLPDPWTESLTHDLALALAVSAGSADRTEWLAWELGTRLRGIDALLTAGTLNYGKAKAIAEAFKHLSDNDAAHAEALILGRLAGKSYLQVLRLATMAATKVDPDGNERRRKEAEQRHSRVRLWREQSGAVALAGLDLPTDEALAAHANVSARAEHYKSSGVFAKAKMDQLRAMAYLDLLNGITAETRISNAHTRANSAADRDSDPDRDGPDNSDGPNSGGGPGGGGPGGEGPVSDKPAGPIPSVPPAFLRPRTDLVIPLGTVLGVANRPGEAHGLGPLDPALCRELAAIAAASIASEFCVTVTDPDGIAIGHGCARNRSAQAPADAPRLTLPARVNLTITLTDLQGLKGFYKRTGLYKHTGLYRPTSPVSSASRGSPWGFVPRRDEHGPPGGFGTWTLIIADGRELTVRLEPVPTFECDHAHESHAYQANDTLRHLVQIRDGECTFPSCTRHARECDFEHATPFHQGGRTCACNAGARSRKCHRVKQSRGWNVTQPKPGFHQWTTPSGRTYTQEPKHYPVLSSKRPPRGYIAGERRFR